MMDNDECHLARPTEPPDQHKGMRGQWGEIQVEAVMSKELRGVEEGMGAGDGDDKKH